MSQIVKHVSKNGEARRVTTRGLALKLHHSCASYPAMNGASPLEIAEVLGHRTLARVKRYSHFAESHTTKVVENINNHIFGNRR